MGKPTRKVKEKCPYIYTILVYTQVARRESVALFMCEFVTLYACSGKDLSSRYVEGAPIAHRPAQDTRLTIKINHAIAGLL